MPQNKVREGRDREGRRKDNKGKEGRRKENKGRKGKGKLPPSLPCSLLPALTLTR
jgi:hypothetical protein